MPSLFAVLKSHAICGTMYRSSGTKHGTKIFEVSKVQTYCGVSKFHLVLGKDEVTSSNLVSSSTLKSLVSLVNPLKQGFFVILYGFEHCCTKFFQLSHNVSHRRFLHFVNGTKCGTEQGG